MKSSSALIDIFNHLFAESEKTLLIGGAQEPLYLPADPDKADSFARIYFREDYFSSALHEIAHWCVAGKKRRQIEDYGYWYKPDGRDQLWQSRFEDVEVKPQAIECIFSSAAGIKFRVSADNLLNPHESDEGFSNKVDAQVLIYNEKGLPRRAKIFHEAIMMHCRAQDVDEWKVPLTLMD